jgi:pimeloyl-ACP methyl ester carboxylesterase
MHIYLLPLFTNTMKVFSLFFALAVYGFAKGQLPVDSTSVIVIGGIKQFISIKSRDNSKPLLLFLHGGPGGSVMGYSNKFTNKLQEHFIVVQWDQRETGKTLDLNRSSVPLTVDLFEEDTHALIDTLLRKFHQPKLYLVAHSWGTALGFRVVKKYPELLYAFIPVGPMINQLESERIILARMKEKAQQEKNYIQLRELSSVRIPFENGEQLFYHRKWLFHFSGSKTKLTRDYVVTWSARWLKLYNEASNENLFKTLPEISCPVYFFAGRNDYQTSSAITTEYYNQLLAPKKDLFIFEKSAHAVPTTEPSLFQQILIEKVLPQTYPGL